MKKIILIIPIIMLILAGCSESNSPTNQDDLFIYSHSTDIVMKVITKDGLEVPKNMWTDVINKTYNDYLNNVKIIKKINIRLENDTLYQIANGQSQGIAYRMNGDTIIVNLSSNNEFPFEYNQALIIDNNTLEQQYTAFAQDLSFGKGGDLSYIIGKYDEFQKFFESRKASLKDDEQVAIFFERLIFEK